MSRPVTIHRVWTANNGNAVSFFEFTTALAFSAFAENRADFVLLETGLGGRLDCTNIIPHTNVCGITSIGFDHTAVLGETVSEIATEKAGIIKPRAEVVVGPQKQDRADAVHLATGTAAARCGADVYCHGVEWHIRPDGHALQLSDGELEYRLPEPALAGRHQYENAATAAMICRRLAAQGVAEISHEALHKGIANAGQNGRLQKLSKQQCQKLEVAGDHTVYLDSAHNGDAAQALAREIEHWQANGTNVALVIGMLRSKDAHAYLAPLASTGAYAVFVPIPGEEANMHAPEDLADIWTRNNGAGADIDDAPITALQQICKTAQTVVITGSGYLLRNFMSSPGTAC